MWGGRRHFRDGGEEREKRSGRKKESYQELVDYILISVGELLTAPVRLQRERRTEKRGRERSSKRRKRLIVSKNTYDCLHFPSFTKGHLKVP